MKFVELCQFFEKISNINSRNKIVEEISLFYKFIPEIELKTITYFLLGKIGPDFLDLEFNFSKKLILKSLEEFDLSSEKILNEFSKYGDLGLLVANLLDNSAKFQTEIGVSEVYEILKQIIQIKGKNSVENKKKIFCETLSKFSNFLEYKYFVKLIMSELRLGMNEKTLLDSFSWHLTGKKTIRTELERAMGAISDIGVIAEVVFEASSLGETLEKLKEIKVKPGNPVASKLVERSSSSADVWKRLPNCIVQPKLDGLRGQIHKWIDEEGNINVKIFSRNLEDMTNDFPEIVLELKKLPLESLILDSEIIGVQKNGDFLTYQETMQRKRKYDIEQFATDIPVNAMCFDILYFDGEDITQLELEKRLSFFEKLNLENFSTIKKLETEVFFSESQLDEYFETKINLGLEGIIAKNPNSIYEAGTRNFEWIKLKANSKREMVDTVDVVLLGYFIGEGKRAKNGIGALLTGLVDDTGEKFYSFAKVGSGITDEVMDQIKKDIEPLIVKDKPINYEVEKQLHPNFWVLPKIVMEIDADEITRSPNHTAGKGIDIGLVKDDFSRGLSARFPRLKYWKRDKKYPNTVKEILNMYKLKKNGRK